MSENTKSRTAIDLGLLFARLPLGVYFMLAGVAKVKGGVGNFVRHGMENVPSYLPQIFGKAYLYALPWMEIVVGVCLMVGIFTRFTGLLVSLMLISFTVAATGWRPLADVGPFHTNIVFLGIALCIMLLGPGRLSVDALVPQRRRR